MGIPRALPTLAPNFALPRSLPAHQSLHDPKTRRPREPEVSFGWVFDAGWSGCWMDVGWTLDERSLDSVENGDCTSSCTLMHPHATSFRSFGGLFSRRQSRVTRTFLCRRDSLTPSSTRPVMKGLARLLPLCTLPYSYHTRHVSHVVHTVHVVRPTAATAGTHGRASFPRPEFWGIVDTSSVGAVM